MSEDDVVFEPEGEDAATMDPAGPPPWKMHVVDDEPGVHQATKLALNGFTLLGNIPGVAGGMNQYEGAAARR